MRGLRFPEGFDSYQILYAPFGIVLALLRCLVIPVALIFFVLFSTYPKAKLILFRLFFYLLGIVIDVSPSSNKNKESTRVFIINSASVLDSIIWQAIESSHVFKDEALSENLTDEGENILKYTKQGIALFVNASESLEELDKTGVMKISPTLMDLKRPISPVFLSLSRPSWCPIACHIESDSFFMNLIWFLYCPCSTFNFTIMPKVEIAQYSPQEGLLLLQNIMAHALKFPKLPGSPPIEGMPFTPPKISIKRPSTLSLSDQLLMEKRQQEGEQSHKSSPLTQCVEEEEEEEEIIDELNEIDKMVAQVIRVVPQSCEKAIRKDLEQYGSVDDTIEKCLLGELPAKEIEGVFKKESPKATEKKKKMTLAERKADMIVTSRKRYLKRRGLPS